ncbi:L-serine ammonia-lyase, iron-sulfur-dependent subunit beta [Caldisalinibacter kiritimatiensis]|uniref:L-serine deaminase n=1 Tax=Caldisalinibacter kiritimatiensis TaxID=1304284 RepID=R1CR84_9FIRM|nr:L-serine ammonia-lyase, iron-sulfur-dependent subunit beta [Caldisalinibacter kiritimatiensis]EOD01191.1 L-serine dehydratase, beta subunit [Caldisalinibacter kiritimatiensis]
MKNYSVFDILGPIMIGPSSSHTAGAARLGKVARYIVGTSFKSVTFYLHGSFAKTYKGHGTDRALVAGVLGMEPHDERLRNSLNIAKKRGINIEFIETDLGYAHPNTVKIVFTKEDDNKIEITGSSIGGGNILITNIDGYNVKFTGEYPTLFIRQYDKKGVISRVSTVLAQNDINIATMKVNRKDRGVEASMIIETDDELSNELVKELTKIENIISVRAINPIKEEV